MNPRAGTSGQRGPVDRAGARPLAWWKRTGRAALIGERTAGANHFGTWQSLGDGLSAFIAFGRTLDPVTGADWEATGVAPDVDVPAVQALDEAVRRATAR